MSFDRKKESGLPPTVVSAETMLGVIETLGIVPFFENPIPGFSIEEMTPKENWFDGQENLSLTPWDWKIPVVQSGDIAYGKFLWGGMAAFATVEWYSELMNWRRSLPKYQPTGDQRLILDYLEEHGSIGIKEIRSLLGVKKSAADALMTRLQMQCRLRRREQPARPSRGDHASFSGRVWRHLRLARPCLPRRKPQSWISSLLQHSWFYLFLQPGNETRGLVPQMFGC